MSELAHEQSPEPWSKGAVGYDAAFARFTGRFADDVLNLLDVAPGGSLLDIATGTGALARRAASRGLAVVAADFAPGMALVVADRLAADEAPARVAVMDGQRLALPDRSVDAGASMFGLMFFPDTSAGIAELARVVRPGGRVAVACWHVDRFRLSAMVAATLGQVIDGFDGTAPEPIWAPLGRPAGLSAALTQQNLADVAVHTVTHHQRLDDPEQFFLSIASWAPPLQPLLEHVGPDTLAEAAHAFAETIAGLGEDGIETDAIIGVGTVT